MMSIKDIWQSSPVIMSILFFCSVLLVATSLERWWCFRGQGRSEESLWAAVQRAMMSRNMILAEQESRRSKSSSITRIREAGCRTDGASAGARCGWA